MAKTKRQRKRPIVTIEAMTKSESEVSGSEEEYNPYLPHSSTNQPPAESNSGQDSETEVDEVSPSIVSPETKPIPVITGVGGLSVDRRLVQKALEACERGMRSNTSDEIEELARRVEVAEDRIRNQLSVIREIQNILENKDFYGRPIITSDD